MNYQHMQKFIIQTLYIFSYTAFVPSLLGLMELPVSQLSAPSHESHLIREPDPTCSKFKDEDGGESIGTWSNSNGSSLQGFGKPL